MLDAKYSRRLHIVQLHRPGLRLRDMIEVRKDRTSVRGAEESLGGHLDILAVVIAIQTV